MIKYSSTKAKLGPWKIECQVLSKLTPSSKRGSMRCLEEIRALRQLLSTNNNWFWLRKPFRAWTSKSGNCRRKIETLNSITTRRRLRSAGSTKTRYSTVKTKYSPLSGASTTSRWKRVKSITIGQVCPETFTYANPSSNLWRWVRRRVERA